MFIKQCTTFLLFLGNVVALRPTGLRLAYRDDPTEMSITWTTLNSKNTLENDNIVRFGNAPGNLTKKAQAVTTKFRAFHIHRAVLKDLGEGNTIWYQCNSQGDVSGINKFKTRTLDTESKLRVLIFGDLGIENGQSIPRILEDVKKDMYDVIHHVGDISYDMNQMNGTFGYFFITKMEAASKILPYMVTPGNHENYGNFTDYKNQYTMPGGTENMFYSYNVGPVHLISISTEFYYYVNFGISQIAVQYNWLVKDLKEATKPENRKKHPWIIIMGHRPMYCSTTDKDDCTFGFAMTRVGIPFLHWWAMEKLLYTYGVDLAVWAHEHIYERMWPVYNLQVMNGSYENPYTNPRATPHIITGSAGNRERLDKFKSHKPAYSAFRDADYGYARLTVENTTHLRFQQISDDKNGKIVDDIWLIRDKHAPYNDLS